MIFGLEVSFVRENMDSWWTTKRSRTTRVDGPFRDFGLRNGNKVEIREENPKKEEFTKKLHSNSTRTKRKAPIHDRGFLYLGKKIIDVLGANAITL